MAGSLVVSDTTAITSLLKINRVELLRDLFESILIPPAVSHELLAYHDSLPPFLIVTELGNTSAVAPLLELLGAGEAEAIVLADEVHADLLLIDDRRGRSAAEARGLRCTGLVGLLVEAKRQGILESVGRTLEDLAIHAHLHLSAAVKAEVLRRAKED